MFDFSKSKTSPIGIDIGFDSVRMIQLQSRSDNVAVVAADEVSLGYELFADENAKHEYFVSAIKEMLGRGQFESNEVISCLPSSELLIKSLRIDANEEDRIDEVVKSGLIERCGLSSKTHDIRFFSAGTIRQGNDIKNEVIVFAVTKEALSRHIQLLEDSGVVPVQIDVVPCALFRSLERSLRRAADKDKANVFVDIGSRCTTVVIGRAGEIIFAKQIDIAGEQINREIALKLGIGLDEANHLRIKLRNPVEAEDIEPATRHLVSDSMHTIINELAKEILLCFKYYSVTFRGHRPDQMIFAGREAYEDALTNSLKKNLEIDIAITQPFRGFDISNVEFPADKRGILCEWAVAVGLSMKGLALNREEVSCERD